MSACIGCGESRHPGHSPQSVHAGKNRGTTTGTGTKDDPIRTTNVNVAAQALAEGRYVELSSQRQVSTLLDDLAARGQDAKAKGKKAPAFNICGMQVKGANVFCAETKGVPRVRMPQLSGVPEKGSKADQLPKNSKGEVDLGPAFIEHLSSRGIAVTPDRVPAEVLKPSQGEMEGAKVGGMIRAMEAGTMPEGSIFVTRDDYVVDGHHRYAAKVGVGFDGGDTTIDVRVIDADIIPVLAMANNFAASMGIPHADLGTPVPPDSPGVPVERWRQLWLESRHPNHKTGTDQSVHAGGKANLGGLGKMLAPVDGGFTFDPRTGLMVTSGWAVGMSNVVPTKTMAADKFLSDPVAGKKLLREHLKAVREQPADIMAGGWHNGDDGGIIMLDHTRVFPPSQKAEAIAFGRANGEISIANLDAITAQDWDNAFVPTGGTGNLDIADARGMVIRPQGGVHGEDTAVHDRHRTPEGDDRRGARRTGGRAVRGRLREDQVGFVDLDAKYGLILRHPGHADQKVHGRRGPLSTWEGTDSVGPKTAEAITKQVEKTWGMSEPEARELAISNLVNAAKAGDPNDADWYFKEHDELQKLADETDVSIETMVAMTSVTSAQMPWGRNKEIAAGIARKLKADEPFDLTQADLDDYNSWVGRRKAGLAQPHLDIKPGRYRPSELPSDLAASKTPGMPRLKNTDYAVAAVNVYRGQSPDSVIQGPKQRSFFNNLVAPADPRFVTCDTWHYDAMGGSHEFVRTIGGETYSHTIGVWRDAGNVTSGVTPKQVSPQDFFQSAPTVKAEAYPSNNGLYPWSVGVTKAAADRYNAEMGTDWTPSQFQAVVWTSVGGGT